MKFIIEWGDYDINSGRKISDYENIQIIQGAVRWAKQIEDGVTDILSTYGYASLFKERFETISQFEVALILEKIGDISHIEFHQELVDEIIGMMTDHLSRWVDCPHVTEEGEIINPGFSEIKFVKS